MAGRSHDLDERLRHLAGEAKALFASLAALLDELPPSTQEASAEDLAEEAGEPVDVRSTVLCVLEDLVRPTVRNLLLAAGAGPDEAAQETPELPGVPGAPCPELAPAVGRGTTAGPPAQELVIQAEGVVPVPGDLAVFLDLVPFDLFIVEQGADHLRFEPLRAFMRGLLLKSEEQLSEDLRGRLTVMIGNGLLVPQGFPPLHPGDRVALEVEPGEHGRSLCVTRRGHREASRSRRGRR